MLCEADPGEGDMQKTTARPLPRSTKATSATLIQLSAACSMPKHNVHASHYVIRQIFIVNTSAIRD